ncbi:MAG: sensor histidine kinase, partial [Pyrinomonadaceae bacterium]
TLNFLANILLPVAHDYRLLPYGAVFTVPGVLIYAYAISNFKLFSFQSALDQFRLFPVAYKVALSIAVVASCSFFFLQVPIIWWSFGGSLFSEAWRRFLVFSVISALVPNLLLVALVIRIISRPLRRLTEAAVTVAGGAYGTRVNLSSNDEVGLLASSFNEMSRKMAEDIERLRQMNTHLIRAEKLAATGTLAAGVAHEVNNPLASISSLIQILQTREKNVLDEQAREYLHLISQQIARITHVLSDMMDFAQARPSTRSFQDVKSIIESSIRLTSFDKQFKKIQIATDWDETAPRVHADPDQLQQVFLNLLLNARDAVRGSENGEIKIKTRYCRDANEIMIEIRDNGQGIKSEHRQHIFEPFFTTKPAGEGTGLGLAICYGMIMGHGGRIEVLPNGQRGICARVTLPVISFKTTTELNH